MERVVAWTKKLLDCNFWAGLRRLRNRGLLRELGYRVTGVDVDIRKVRAVEDGQSPFYEPGLEALIQSTCKIRGCRPRSLQPSIADADFAFLCVGRRR